MLAKARMVLPFPEEFKTVDYHPYHDYRKMYFEYCTDSGKSMGPYRRIKYKHGVEVLL